MLHCAFLIRTVTAPSVATVPALHEIFACENDLSGICVNVVIFAS